MTPLSVLPLLPLSPFALLSSLESDKVVDNEDSLERAKSRRKLSALLHPLDESESDKGISNKDDEVGIHEPVVDEENMDE